MPESNPLPPPTQSDIEVIKSLMYQQAIKYADTPLGKYLAQLAASLTVTMGWKSVPIPLDAPPDEWRFTTDWEPAEGGGGDDC